MLLTGFLCITDGVGYLNDGCSLKGEEEVARRWLVLVIL